MTTMKKSGIAAILVCALALALSMPSYAFAATNQGQYKVCPRGIAQTSTFACLNILDKSTLQLYGQRINQGVGYVDANNDGICDNFTGGGQGTGAGYIDADNDGICDNYETQQNTRYNSGKHQGAGKGYNRY